MLTHTPVVLDTAVVVTWVGRPVAEKMIAHVTGVTMDPFLYGVPEVRRRLRTTFIDGRLGLGNGGRYWAGVSPKPHYAARSFQRA